MPRPLDQPLDIERAVAESALCLAARGGNGFRNRAGLARDAHAFAAAAGRRLDEDRISDRRRCCGDARVRLVRGSAPRNDGHTGFFHERTCADFRSHALDCVRRRPDEQETGVGTRGREC